MADARSTGRVGGWTRLFRKGEVELTGDHHLLKFLQGVARIFEGGAAKETADRVSAQVKQIFGCDEVSLFVYDADAIPNLDDGEWVLTVKAGFGEGARVTQNDAKTMPSLVPGKLFPHSEQLAEKAALKAIALAFEEGRFYGCDIERKKVILIRDPKPADDMGSGDLSVLAIPLTYINWAGRVPEKSRVGVMALYRVPVRDDWGEVEKFLRSMIAYAVTAPSCMLRDPISNVYNEGFLRERLSVYCNMLDMTGGKLRGGLVVGMVDTLRLYKQTLEAEGNVDPSQVSLRVSEAIRGVGACLWRRARNHALGMGSDFACGDAARIGQEGFGVLLPLLRPLELKMWALRVQKEVLDYPFVGEEALPLGEISVSLRVIPLGQSHTRRASVVWKTALAALEDVERSQLRLAGRELKDVVNTIQIYDEQGRWVAAREYTAPNV